MSWLADSERRYADSCRSGRRGVELDDADDTPQCQHVNGCEARTGDLCSCGEPICEDHGYLCDEGDCPITVCDGCSRESVYDQQRRCAECAGLHNDVMRRKVA